MPKNRDKLTKTASAAGGLKLKSEVIFIHTG